MKRSVGISNFLDEIFGLSPSIVFLYLFALITEEGFLISPCFPLELCTPMCISFLFSSVYFFSSFSQLFVRPPQTAILPFAFIFLGMVLIIVVYIFLVESLRFSLCSVMSCTNETLLLFLFSFGGLYSFSLCSRSS